MKTMKSKIFILITLALLLTVSCTDYLEEKTFNQMTPELLYTSAEYAQLAVNGCYMATFMDRLGYQMYWPATWGVMCQEFSMYNQNARADYKWNSADVQVYWVWRNFFNAIDACNSTISGIEGMSSDIITEEQRNEFLAQARFLRSHNYYHLLIFWGGVPVHTEPTENPEVAFKPRSSAQEVFDLIESDLKFAQQHLPVNWAGGFPDVGRATKGSATARLAQLYCVASGEQFKGNDAVGGDANFNNLGTYWNEARAELASLIDEGNPSQAKAPYMYALEPDLKYLYTGGKQDGAVWSNEREQKNWGQEIIWSTTYDPEVVAGTWNFNHWQARYISPYIRDRFIPGEYRALIKHDSTQRPAEGWIVCAHIKRNRTGNNNENQFYFARYAGILLLMAYVENEVNNGPTALAEACLNAVRARARAGDGVTTYTEPADVTPGLSYAEFKDEVMDERFVELLHEEKFMFDAWMSGIMERDWDNIASGADGNRGPYDKKWKQFPIPEREIITSGGLLLQNPGH
jgi:hypothetical protein